MQSLIVADGQSREATIRQQKADAAKAAKGILRRLNAVVESIQLTDSEHIYVLYAMHIEDEKAFHLTRKGDRSAVFYMRAYPLGVSFSHLHDVIMHATTAELKAFLSGESDVLPTTVLDDNFKKDLLEMAQLITRRLHTLIIHASAYYRKR